MIQKTVLDDLHTPLGGRMVDFSGWWLPISYAGVLAEHQSCRTSAAVFDTGHMGLFHIAGKDAAEWFSHIGTQDAPRQSIGRCRYGFLLNEEGGVLDDTVLVRLGAEDFVLVVNAGTADTDFAWIEARLQAPVQLENLSRAGWGKVDVQGPLSYGVLAPLCAPELGGLQYFTGIRTRCMDADCIITRTGYTGELGFEVLAPGATIRALFQQLVADDRVSPAGLGARDSLRLEMSYPLYGHELSTAFNPIEAGLGAFATDSHSYIGATALAEIRAAGPKRHLVAFTLDSRRKPAPGDAITVDGRTVGEVTSGTFLPSLACGGGLGYVDPSLASAGTELRVVCERGELVAHVKDKPLYASGTCRQKLNP